MTKDPLHPIARQILQERLAVRLPPLSEWTPQFARSLNEAEPSGPATRKIVLKAKEREIPLNIFTPKGDGPFPLILFFHGGGFLVGFRGYEITLQKVADFLPAIIIAPEYRLAPEHKFPAAVDDAIFVFEKVLSGIDVDKKYLPNIIVAGDSAGGNLAANVTAHAVQNKISQLSGQMLFYPWLDLALSGNSYREFANDFGLTQEKITWYRNHYLPEQNAKLFVDPRVSPMYAKSFSNFPRSYIATAGCDVVRDDGETYAAKLKAAGSDVKMKRFDGMIHGFLEQGDRLPQVALELFQDIKQFIYSAER
jgi:acetyl esterase